MQFKTDYLRKAAALQSSFFAAMCRAILLHKEKINAIFGSKDQFYDIKFSRISQFYELTWQSDFATDITFQKNCDYFIVTLLHSVIWQGHD